MIWIDATTHTLEIKLGGAVATNESPIVCSFVEDARAYWINETGNFTTNGATAVTIIAAPGTGFKRAPTFISLWNKDTAAITVTLQYNANGTRYEIKTQALAVGETFLYEAP